MEKSLVKISKFLSLVLRHKPEVIGLELDAEGWASVQDLIDKSERGLDIEVIQTVVQTNDKKRFALSEDGAYIRANQGHSLSVDLGLAPMEPPEKLYHGTASRFLDAILAEGLRPQNRQYVHLSADAETAINVGQRYGKPVVFIIDAGRMADDDFEFYRSENGVWLTDKVPPVYLEVSE